MKMKPDIMLHIDRLVLDGLALQPVEAARLRAALESELSRLLSAGGLGSAWQSGGAVPELHAAAVEAGTLDPILLGKQIARSLYAGLGGGEPVQSAYASHGGQNFSQRPSADQPAGARLQGGTHE